MLAATICLSQYLTPDWLTAIGTIGATVVALYLGLADKIRGLFIHPKLVLDARMAAPLVENTNWGSDRAEVWYFRFAVTNEGREVAREAFLFLEKVERIEEDKRVRVKRFNPMFFKWSHVGWTTQPALWPKIPRYCDIFHLTIPSYVAMQGESLPGVSHIRTVLALDLEVKPNQKGHLLEPGIYFFTIKLGAANTKLRTKVFRVEFDGVWHPKEEAMFRHVKIDPV